MGLLLFIAKQRDTNKINKIWQKNLYCKTVDWLQLFPAFFCHSLSLPVAVFVSLIPFHFFTTETSVFSTKGHNLSNHYKLY